MTLSLNEPLNNGKYTSNLIMNTIINDAHKHNSELNVNNFINGIYRTPLSLIKHLGLKKTGLVSPDDYSLSCRPIIKQWNKLLLGTSLLPKHETYTIKNRKVVLGRAKQIRVPCTEPGLIKVFSRMYGLKLPGVNPVTTDDVKSSDDETLGLYCREKSFNVRDDVSFARALESTLYTTNIGSIVNKPYRHVSIIEALTTLKASASSCYPLFLKKSSKAAINEAVEFVQMCYNSNNDLYTLMKLLWSNLTVVFHRVTLKVVNTNRKAKVDFKRKIRQVFGVAFGPLLLETILFNRMNEHLQRNSNTFTYGMTRPEISERIADVHSQCRVKGYKFILSGDLDSCDASISPKLCLLFFSVLIVTLRIPPQLRTLAEALAYYLTYTPILAYDTVVRFTVGGNKSGMKTTTLINCFVINLAANYFSFRKYGKPYGMYEFQGLGDDFILGLKSDQDFGFLVEVFSELGLTLNKSKTKVYKLDDERVTFLGFEWFKKGREFVPDQSDGWIIGHTAYPERYIESLKGEIRTVARTLSIIFQLERGKEIFKKLWIHDPKMRELLISEGFDFEVPIIVDDSRISGEMRTIRQLLEHGWKMF